MFRKINAVFCQVHLRLLNSIQSQTSSPNWWICSNAGAKGPSHVWTSTSSLWRLKASLLFYLNLCLAGRESSSQGNWLEQLMEEACVTLLRNRAGQLCSSVPSPAPGHLYILSAASSALFLPHLPAWVKFCSLKPFHVYITTLLLLLSISLWHVQLNPWLEAHLGSMWELVKGCSVCGVVSSWLHTTVSYGHHWSKLLPEGTTLLYLVKC